MDILEAEQDAAYQAGLERMAKEKDLFVSNPKNLDDTFSCLSSEQRIEFFDIVRELCELSLPLEQHIRINANLQQILQILGTVRELSNHVEGMVEEHLENNSE